MTDVNGLSLGTAASPFFFPGAAATMGGDDATQDDLVRRNNSIFYASPNFGGATFMAYAALGEYKNTAGKTSSTKGNVYNIAANYANGPLFIMGSVLYQDLAPSSLPADRGGRTDKKADKNIYYELAGTYDFGFTKAGLQLEYKDGYGTAEAPSIFVGQLGATTPAFGGRINTTVAYLHDFDKDDADGYSFGIRYDYALSKRTMVYAGFEAVINEDNAQRSIEAGPDSSLHFVNTAAGNDQQQFFVGMRHRF